MQIDSETSKKLHAPLLLKFDTVYQVVMPEHGSLRRDSIWKFEDGRLKSVDDFSRQSLEDQSSPIGVLMPVEDAIIVTREELKHLGQAMIDAYTKYWIDEYHFTKQIQYFLKQFVADAEQRHKENLIH